MQKKPGYFERLRAKPLSYRRTYVFLVSLGTSLVIFGIWSISTVSRLTSASGEQSLTASASTSMSVFSSIKDEFSQGADDNPLTAGQAQGSSDPANSISAEPTDTSGDSAYTDTSASDQGASTSTDNLVQ